MYLPPLTDEQADVRKTMPTLDGFITSLFHVPPGRLDTYEARWREWCAQTPAKFWPDWIEAWGAYRKARRRSS